MAFKHGWKSSKLSVAIVKNHEFKIAHVALSQGASSTSEGSGGAEDAGNSTTELLSSVWAGPSQGGSSGHSPELSPATGAWISYTPQGPTRLPVPREDFFH